MSQYFFNNHYSVTGFLTGLVLLTLTGCSNQALKPDDYQSMQKDCPSLSKTQMDPTFDTYGWIEGTPFNPLSVEYTPQQLQFKDEKSNVLSIYFAALQANQNTYVLPENTTFVLNEKENGNRPNITIINTEKKDALGQPSTQYINTPYSLLLKTDRYQAKTKTMPGTLFLCLNQDGHRSILAGKFNASVKGLTTGKKGQVLTQDDSFETFNLLAKEALLKKHPAAQVLTYVNHQLWNERRNDPDDKTLRNFAYLEVIYNSSSKKNTGVLKFIFEKKRDTDNFSIARNVVKEGQWELVEILTGQELKEAHRGDFLNTTETSETVENELTEPAQLSESIINQHYPDKQFYFTKFHIENTQKFFKKVSLQFKIMGDNNIKTLVLYYDLEKVGDKLQWILKEKNLDQL